MFKMVEVLGNPSTDFLESSPKRTKCFTKQRNGDYVCVASTGKVWIDCRRPQECRPPRSAG